MNQNDSSDMLIVPVYLNQKLVFDLLAMLQGGISTVTAVTKTDSSSKTDQDRMSAGFGLSEAFSTLLKIDLSGNKSRSNTTEEGGTSSEERVHTPASLLYQLRGVLVEKNYLKELLPDKPPIPGDFIEFEGTLKRNPIIETLDSLVSMMEIAKMFEESPQQKGKNSRNNQVSEYEKMKKQMSSLLESLKAGDTVDLTANNLKTEHTAVVTVETSFLNNPMMSDLVDGQFKVIGKVVRSVTDKSQNINLLRKTAWSKMPPQLLSQLFNSLELLNSEQGFGIPKLEWEVEGPAIQILPIAIYA